MEITFYGHACFHIQLENHALLFDPFISPNELASHIDVNGIEADFILLSHGHGDHVADAESIAKRCGATLVANYEVATWFQNKGIEKVHPMNHGGSWEFPFGRVKAVNAVHSSMLPDGSYGGNPMGFVIEAGGKTFYYAGDTALTLDMKLIAEQFDIDFAILPIGSNFTMDHQDAMRAAELVNTRHVIAMHFDTFPYIKVDHEAVAKEAELRGIDLFIPKIGETIHR